MKINVTVLTLLTIYTETFYFVRTLLELWALSEKMKNSSNNESVYQQHPEHCPEQVYQKLQLIKDVDGNKFE